MENFNNMSSFGKILVDQLQRLAAEGHIPQFDIAAVSSPEELLAYLNTKVKETVSTECPCSAACDHPCCGQEAPNEPAEEAAPQKIHVFRVTRSKPEERFSDSVLPVLLGASNYLDELNRNYYDLYRTRGMVHAIRDIPNLDDPKHIANLVECCNQIDSIQTEIIAQVRMIQIMESLYGDTDEIAETCTQQIRKATDMLRRVLPLGKLLNSKLMDAMDENAFESGCLGCPGCLGCNEDD